MRQISSERSAEVALLAPNILCSSEPGDTSRSRRCRWSRTMCSIRCAGSTDIVEAEHGEPFDALFDLALQADALAYDELVQAGAGAKTVLAGSLSFQHWVDPIDHHGNRRQRVERLTSAWNQRSDGGAEPAGEPDDPLIGASAEPKKRPRTRLSDSEVDAMRTARGQGVSVTALARCFGVHRGTVWAKTR